MCPFYRWPLFRCVHVRIFQLWKLKLSTLAIAPHTCMRSLSIQILWLTVWNWRVSVCCGVSMQIYTVLDDGFSIHGRHSTERKSPPNVWNAFKHRSGEKTATGKYPTGFSIKFNNAHTHVQTKRTHCLQSLHYQTYKCCKMHLKHFTTTCKQSCRRRGGKKISAFSRSSICNTLHVNVYLKLI